MRAHTTLYAAAILALATFTACGGEAPASNKPVEASCPAGYALVSVEDTVICALLADAALSQCGEGTYLKRDGTCAVLCEPGMSIGKDGTCQPVTFTTSCAEGFLLDTRTGSCLPRTVPPTCAEGWALNERTGECVKPESQDCPNGQYLAYGTCVQVPNAGEPFVYIGHKEPGIYRVTQASVGQAHVAFDLTVITNREVRLRSIGFLPVFLKSTGWERDRDFTMASFDSCAIVGSPNSAAWHRPDMLSDGSEAEFSLSYPDTIRGRVDLTVECQIKTGVDDFTYGIYLYAAGIDDVITGELFTRPEILFGASNVEMRQTVQVDGGRFCAVPTIGLASNLGSTAAIPSFGEVLQINVVAPTCDAYAVTEIQYRLTVTDNANTGWMQFPTFGLADVGVYDADDSTHPVTGSWFLTDSNKAGVHAGDTVTYASFHPIEQVVGAGATKTYSFKMNSSGASASQDDVLRVDVTRFCVRSRVTGEESCMDWGTSLVTGGVFLF